jgi:hypothetical protein
MIRNYIDKEVTEISEEKLIEIYESAKDHWDSISFEREGAIGLIKGKLKSMHIEII